MSTTNPPPFDPCAEYTRLQQVLTDIVTGDSVRRVRYKNGDEERETEFSQANIGELRRVMADLKMQCQEKTTGRPARSAISFGRARRPYRSVY